MRTRREKEDFIFMLKQEIKHREILRKAFNTTFQKVVESFDGKVYNKRFDSALNDALKNISPMMWAKCELQSPNSYSNFPKCNILQVVINYRNEEYNYTNNESLYTNIVLKADANYNLRIDAADSKAEKYTIIWAEDFDKGTEERKGVITSYGKYLRIAEQMAKAVEKYNALPFCFRKNIDATTLHIY